MGELTRNAATCRCCGCCCCTGNDADGDDDDDDASICCMLLLMMFLAKSANCLSSISISVLLDADDDCRLLRRRAFTPPSPPPPTVAPPGDLRRFDAAADVTGAHAVELLVDDVDARRAGALRLTGEADLRLAARLVVAAGVTGADFAVGGEFFAGLEVVVAADAVLSVGAFVADVSIPVGVLAADVAFPVGAFVADVTSVVSAAATRPLATPLRRREAARFFTGSASPTIPDVTLASLAPAASVDCGDAGLLTTSSFVLLSFSTFLRSCEFNTRLNNDGLFPFPVAADVTCAGCSLSDSLGGADASEHDVDDDTAAAGDLPMTLLVVLTSSTPIVDLPCFLKMSSCSKQIKRLSSVRKM